MTGRPIDMVGRRYGRLRVIAKEPKPPEETREPDGFRWWICRCDCGSPEFIVRGDKLRSGRRTSCGCDSNVQRAASREAVIAAIMRANGHVGTASTILGITYKSLRKRLQRDIRLDEEIDFLRRQIRKSGHFVLIKRRPVERSKEENPTHERTPVLRVPSHPAIPRRL